MHRFLLVFLIQVASIFPSYSQHAYVYKDSSETVNIGKSVEFLEDRAGRLTLSEVMKSGSFRQNYQDVCNLGVSRSTYWLKMIVTNSLSARTLLFQIKYPSLTFAECYVLGAPENSRQESGMYKPFTERKYAATSPLFELDFNKGETKTVYLKVRSNDELVLPIYLGSTESLLQANAKEYLTFGIYSGIILVMILYNLFIYFSIRDSNYLYYVIYILFVGLSQAVLGGYAFKYLWPDLPWLARQSLNLIPALSGIAVVEFTKNFLNLREKSPRMVPFLNFMNGAYILAFLISLLNQPIFSHQILLITGLTGSLYILFIAGNLVYKNFRPAKFFLIGFSFFLIAIILFVLRNLNLIPFNSFTENILLTGSAAEVTLLSFALADSINILKQEKEDSQAIALSEAKKNENLIRDQNINLEKMVDERTNQLTTAMDDLQLTMDNLKNTQAQLVDSEKMASLGQLTAGIAHEINNPINFVTSNIKPLKRDINDLYEMLAKFENGTSRMEPAFVAEVEKLKKDLDLDYVKSEIDLLLRGIDEGAFRTSEIIRGLKMFARVDEQDIKDVNLNEGFESTLLLLNSKIKDRIKLDLKLGVIPKIECYAGKLNQVFMNIITNSIYAINQHHGDAPTGTLSIETKINAENDQEVVILIQDNGSGMPEAVKLRIFDPFFTTKPIGEGTGLGLSIVQQIISGHKGFVEVLSEDQKGTQFKIILPVRQ